MGVPKFFRWISERYPCLSQIIKEHQIPEFDNLYLDMNGIIHNCSHPDDANAHFRISEEKIFLDIFSYIEVLFRIIKPRKVLFMAIDGIAPRAKMNQQRSRRFRSAMEAKQVIEKAKSKGEELPTEEAFDSNCITPGTEFMDKLHRQLKYFISRKISTDEAWQNVDIYLSGHETPGEGEHKIMEFIRHLRSTPDYDHNTRHCLYGLDADLIILGLASHEPHFSLLREEVIFGKRNKNKKSSNAEDIQFYLLHLSLLRDYLDCEFCDVQNKIKFPYDLERIIDDWILLGYLVGNDFIPHLPHLHIHQNALVKLELVYKELLPTFEGYLHEHGKLNITRFEKLLKKLSEFDLEQFQETYDNIKWLEMKRGGGIQPFSDSEETGNISDKAPENLDKEVEIENDLKELIQESEMITADDVDTDTLEEEFKIFRNNYYEEKLEMNPVTEEKIQRIANDYIKTIHWILQYYYCGVQSWSWFYPHHYAPYISDITNFKSMDIELEMSEPFLPFQQLMAVLPEASKKLLPIPYQSLMTSPNSPIINFYPVNFNTDLNEKQNSWEAVVKIPFIDESLLLQAMKTVEHHLTDKERKRNKHGPHLLFRYKYGLDYGYKSPHPAFPDIFHCRSSLEEIDEIKFRLKPEAIMHGLHPKVKLGVYYPGFPTLQHLDFTTELVKANVKVFQGPSKNENLILKVQNKCNKMDVNNIAKDLIGKICFVGWPHLVQAFVTEVIGEDTKYSRGKDWTKYNNNLDISPLKPSEREQRNRDIDNIKSSYMERQGIDIGTTEILVKALLLVGQTCTLINGGKNISLENQWSDKPQLFAYQIIVKDIHVYDQEYSNKARTLSEFFSINCTCFLLKSVEQKPNFRINYGASGKVIYVDEVTNRIRLRVMVVKEPDFSSIRARQDDLSPPYWTSHDAAYTLNVPPVVIAFLTGTYLIFSRGKSSNSFETKMNIGLNLKQSKKNKEVVGYTHKVNNQFWVYSDKAIDLLRTYINRFPKIVSVIAHHEPNKKLYQEHLKRNNISQEMLEELRQWLQSLPNLLSRQVNCGSYVLEAEVVTEIENCVEKFTQENHKAQIIQVYVKPNIIFKPYAGIGKVSPNSDADFQLYDRVVNIKQGIAVPCGCKGTVIGVYNEENIESSSIVCDVLFDISFPGGMSLRCSDRRGYRMATYNLLNLTYGMRKGKYNGPNSQFKKSPNLKENRTSHKTTTKRVGRNDPVENKSMNAAKKPDESKDIGDGVQSRRQAWQNMKAENHRSKGSNAEKLSNSELSMPSTTASRSETIGEMKDSKHSHMNAKSMQNKDKANTTARGTQLIKGLLKIGTDDHNDTPATVTKEQPLPLKRATKHQEKGNTNTKKISEIVKSLQHGNPIDAVRNFCLQNGRSPPIFRCYKTKDGMIGVIELDDGIQFSSPSPSLELKEAYSTASLQALQYLENQLRLRRQHEQSDTKLTTEIDAEINETGAFKPSESSDNATDEPNKPNLVQPSAVSTLTEQLKSIGVRNISSVKVSQASNRANFPVPQMTTAPPTVRQPHPRTPINNIFRPPMHYMPMPPNVNIPMYPMYGYGFPRVDPSYYHHLRMPVETVPQNNPRPHQSFVPLQVMKNTRSMANKHNRNRDHQTKHE